MKEHCITILSRNQLRLTRQRKVILDVLEHTTGVHLSAEDIYHEVKKIMPEIGLATVYRSLELFARLDILHKNSFDEGKYRYELREENRHFHHHFICLSCNGIIEVKEDLLQQLEADMESKGFKVVDHSLNLYGYCPNCW